MTDETTRAGVIARRALVFPGVRKGILRQPGTLVVTVRRLIFLPETSADDEVLRRLLDAADDQPLGDIVDDVADAADARPGGFTLDRTLHGLTPPDADGRLRLLQVGHDDDLLIPQLDAPLLALAMGPGAPQREGPTLAALTGRDADAAEQTRGYWGPVSAGLGGLLGVVLTPTLAILSIVMAEEIDDEGAALFFLAGGAAVALGHLISLALAGVAFARRETTRMWGIASVAPLLLSLMVVSVGVVFALDELF